MKIMSISRPNDKEVSLIKPAGMIGYVVRCGDIEESFGEIADAINYFNVLCGGRYVDTV